VRLIDAQGRRHDGHQHRIDGVALADDGNDAGIPGLGQNLRFLRADQYDPLGVGKRQGKPGERRPVQHQNTVLRRIRPLDRFDMPCATMCQRLPNSHPINRIGDRKLDCLHNGAGPTHIGYFFS